MVCSVLAAFTTHVRMKGDVPGLDLVGKIKQHVKQTKIWTNAILSVNSNDTILIKF